MKYFHEYKANIESYPAKIITIFLQNFEKFMNDNKSEEKNVFHYAFCLHCEKFSIWVNQKMIYPLISTKPLAHSDMPDNIKKTYNEARSVASSSSRAAAALLRVALEELTKHLGEKEGNLNKRIGNLKQKGLPETVIKSLDIVRIYANEGGAHSGKIDLENKDNKGIVDKLFNIINFIVEKTITEKKEIEEMFKELPKSKKEGIKNRDIKN